MPSMHHRRHDPAFGAPGSSTDIGSDYLSVAGGSMLHNALTSRGWLGKILMLGPINITQLGALAGVGGFLAEKFGMIRQNGLISDIAKGVFAEGLNAPRVENIQRTGGTSTPGGQMQGAGPQNAFGTGYSSPFAVSAGNPGIGVGPYATPVWWWT